jgi:hypothetical protein
MTGPRTEKRSSLPEEFAAFLGILRAGTPSAGEADKESGELPTDPEAAQRRAEDIAADETDRFLKFREACLKDGRP